MSALAGLWHFDGKPGSDDGCARMLRAQEIYGPHDGATWSNGALTMGRRLFRLLPEDANDRQPQQSRDGPLVLVADVRLDYRDELSAALSLPAAEASRWCDAAILLASIERWGEATLDRIAGDFAFALWDAHAQKLMLARDFRGTRPLHYHRGRGFFAFASMPKGLHALSAIPLAPDEQAVAEFLALMPRRGPHSFFKDVSRVEPGQVVTVTRDGILTRHYWTPPRSSSTRRRDDYVEGLRHHLDAAVRTRLRGANGAVATHLSGGYDSAAVTATAARLMAPSGGKVVAFTSVPRAGFDGASPRNRVIDEGPLAAATAAMHANIEHVLIRGAGTSPLAGFDRDFFLFGRPMLNPSNAVWMHAINQAARERKLNVLLSGQMGNVTLSYGGIELLPELLLSLRLLQFWRTAAKLVATTDMRWRGALAAALGPVMPAWLWQFLNKTFAESHWDIRAYSAIRPAFARKLAPRARALDLDFAYRPWKDGFAMRLWVLSRGDPGEDNKGCLAGWGVDQRDPTADKRLVEYCLSVPSEQYLAGGGQRALARRALADRLPPQVLNERRKGYQAADWYEGLTAARGDVAAELERLAACKPAADILDIERMKRLVADWPASGWERADVTRTYRLALARGLAAGHFLRKASGANS